MDAPTGFAQRLKRGFDLAIGALLIVLTLPALAIAIAMVQCVDRGPVFFRQRRIGWNQRRFMMFKIRTMVTDANDQLESYLSTNAAEGEEWRRFRRLRSDPRIVPYVGRLIRRLSVDELPQLWNVVAGDMSLVGPRPLEEDVVIDASAERLERRARVRPGMTGLWQVSGRSDIDLQQMIELDDAYVMQWSLGADLSILARTPAAVVSRRGAF